MQAQRDLDASKADMDDYRERHVDMTLYCFEVRKELILDVLLVE